MGRKRKQAEDYVAEFEDFDLSEVPFSNSVVCRYCRVEINIDTGHGKGRICEHIRSERHIKLKYGFGRAPPVRMLPTGHSPDNASMHVEAYGENHGEFIIPMSDVAEQQLIARPSTAPRDAAHSMVLSDVRSLVTAPPEIQIKEEVPDRDGTVENPDNGNEGDVIEDVAAPALPAASPLPSPPVLHVVPQTVATPPPTATNGPFFAKNRNRRPAPYASSTQDRKSRLEIEVLLATKRKLEAEERRANAEAEFYLEEKRRSMALVSLHQEERRKLSAITELHVEERRKASSKADLLQEHRNYYLEQQRTEVVRRRLLLLEIQKIKKELKGQR